MNYDYDLYDCENSLYLILNDAEKQMKIKESLDDVTGQFPYFTHTCFAFLQH